MKITDEKLLKIALITSLIGLIGLIIFTPSIEVKKIEIKDINRRMIDEEVCIECVIEEIKSSQSKNNYFLTINDGTGQMSLIIFESQLTNLKNNGINIETYKGKRVNVIGTITEYNSQLELILSNENNIKII